MARTVSKKNNAQIEELISDLILNTTRLAKLRIEIKYADVNDGARCLDLSRQVEPLMMNIQRILNDLRVFGIIPAMVY